MVTSGSTRADDADLAVRVAAGDVRAFEALYQRYGSHALALAVRITGSLSSGEDATQEAFLGLWRTARRYDPDRGTLRTWLLAMVHNRSIDSLRRTARHERHAEIDDALADQLEAEDCTEEMVLTRDESHHTRQLVAGLPTEQRQVIEMAFFAGLTQREIATSVGIPVGTVKGRQRLALAKMHAGALSGAYGWPAL
jgi:RNA polymerase sigma-70 factor (ECF subfamily)